VASRAPWLTSPRLLLMDEPLAALDLKRKQEILPYLERLHASWTFLCCTSATRPMKWRAGRPLVVLEAGRVVAAGPWRNAGPHRPAHSPGGRRWRGAECHGGRGDHGWHLARVNFPGGSLWVRDGGHALGQPVRVRILARDVSIALQRSTHTSIQNCLSAVVDEIADDQHPALSLIRLNVGESPVLARLTRRSAAVNFDQIGL
jgi:molybdate transport system ATP-binding protein